MYENIINYICMLRQFETRSSARPTAAACEFKRKKHYRATAINTARITVPKRIITQTMITNPQGSRHHYNFVVKFY